MYSFWRKLVFKCYMSLLKLVVNDLKNNFYLFSFILIVFSIIEKLISLTKVSNYVKSLL